MKNPICGRKRAETRGLRIEKGGRGERTRGLTGRVIDPTIMLGRRASGGALGFPAAMYSLSFLSKYCGRKNKGRRVSGSFPATVSRAAINETHLCLPRNEREESNDHSQEHRDEGESNGSSRPAVDFAEDLRGRKERRRSLVQGYSEKR